MLLTDDGELTFRLTQARFGVEKEYHVLVEYPELEHALEPERVLERMRAGVMLDDGLARAVRTRLLRPTARGGLIRVVLIEGRQRQVRRMFTALGCASTGCSRVRIGPLSLGDRSPASTARCARARSEPCAGGRPEPLTADGPAPSAAKPSGRS